MLHHVAPHRRCRLFIHVSCETHDVTPCHTSSLQGVPCGNLHEVESARPVSEGDETDRRMLQRRDDRSGCCSLFVAPQIAADARSGGFPSSRFIKGGCSGNRVQWFTLYCRLCYYMIITTHIHCTPLRLHLPLTNALQRLPKRFIYLTQRFIQGGPLEPAGPRLPSVKQVTIRQIHITQ